MSFLSETGTLRYCTICFSFNLSCHWFTQPGVTHWNQPCPVISLFLNSLFRLVCACAYNTHRNGTAAGRSTCGWKMRDLFFFLPKCGSISLLWCGQCVLYKLVKWKMIAASNWNVSAPVHIAIYFVETIEFFGSKHSNATGSWQHARHALDVSRWRSPLRGDEAGGVIAGL